MSVLNFSYIVIGFLKKSVWHLGFQAFLCNYLLEIASLFLNCVATRTRAFREDTENIEKLTAVA